MSHFAGPADLVPMLSRGKHRSPRKGACFMEMASYLAGERWSDHPSCTHPLLASLARCVNDCTSDEARPLLAPLIPSVIGLTSDDVRVDLAVASRCARTALPVASAARQNVLAVSLLTCDRVQAQLDDAPADRLSPGTREALASVPAAARWANEFSRRLRTTPKGFRRHAAPSIVRTSVEAVALAVVPDPDRLLRELLTAAVDDCVALIRPDAEPHPVGAEEWSAACRLTASGRV